MDRLKVVELVDNGLGEDSADDVTEPVNNRDEAVDDTFEDKLEDTLEVVAREELDVVLMKGGTELVNVVVEVESVVSDVGTTVKLVVEDPDVERLEVVEVELLVNESEYK